METGQVTLYIATSVDGYVADEEGGVDWLEEFHSGSSSAEDDAGFDAFFETVDCLVMGATTYEQVLGFDAWPYRDKPTYVFTHRTLQPATEAVEFVDGAVTALSTELKRRYEHVWLVGGAQLAQAFLRGARNRRSSTVPRPGSPQGGDLALCRRVRPTTTAITRNRVSRHWNRRTPLRGSRVSDVN